MLLTKSQAKGYSAPKNATIAEPEANLKEATAQTAKPRRRHGSGLGLLNGDEVNI
jgi:hypothetical protein